jgi:hypothetical protein
MALLRGNLSRVFCRLTGDYIWRQSKQVEQGKFRPLRMLDEA